VAGVSGRPFHAASPEPTLIRAPSGYASRNLHIRDLERPHARAKWGNGLAVRLPAAVVEALDLKQGDEIEIHVAGARELAVGLDLLVDESFAAADKQGPAELPEPLRGAVERAREAQLPDRRFVLILLLKENTLMPDAARLYTAAEAGAVSGLNLKAVHNAIDKRVVEPVAKAGAARGGGAKRPSPRYLTGEDLVRLRVWWGVGDALSAERRRRLFRAIAATPGAKTVKADELLIVDVGEARKQVDRGVRDLEAAETAIAKNRAILGGEPVFKGTRIPVYGVVAMLEAGAAAEDLLSGYPKLTERLLELARIWVTAHPRRGRPKSLSDYGLKQKSSNRVPLRPDPLPRPIKSTVPAGE